MENRMSDLIYDMISFVSIMLFVATIGIWMVAL